MKTDRPMDGLSSAVRNFLLGRHSGSASCRRAHRAAPTNHTRSHGRFESARRHRPVCLGAPSWPCRRRGGPDNKLRAFTARHLIVIGALWRVVMSEPEHHPRDSLCAIVVAQSGAPPLKARSREGAAEWSPLAQPSAARLLGPHRTHQPHNTHRLLSVSGLAGSLRCKYKLAIKTTHDAESGRRETRSDLAAGGPPRLPLTALRLAAANQLKCEHRQGPANSVSSRFHIR
jgi:hypothetical protein